MTANTAVSLPLGPLDPERSELLRRVVDGLEPATPAVAVRFRLQAWPTPAARSIPSAARA